MQANFSCSVEFAFSTDSNELTIELSPDREDTGVEEKKSIKLENPNDFKTTAKTVLKVFNSMLPEGMYVTDIDPLVNELKKVLTMAEE